GSQGPAAAPRPSAGSGPPPSNRRARRPRRGGRPRSPRQYSTARFGSPLGRVRRFSSTPFDGAVSYARLSWCDELIQVHTINRWESAATLLRAARPLACSAAIHLGLGALIVAASSVELPAPPPRAVWLDLTPAHPPPPP